MTVGNKEMLSERLFTHDHLILVHHVQSSRGTCGSREHNQRPVSFVQDNTMGYDPAKRRRIMRTNIKMINLELVPP